ncbi:MAG: hypothetical protein F4Z28_16550 [Gammaproteobacteria bacterium]|nr:hypothetical protein [Gammaproteobacteria bacterium]
MFDQVDLIDGVDEVVGLHDAPENPVHADAHLPLRITRESHEQRVGLVHIRMGPTGVLAVEPEERR